ncbi:2'-5' RNA ligase family protein [Pseudonocardia sp. MH-G8]|uniref:2'-5' RNA ligase family protein n=1 Tax=Pseudonocardia sp. MH-G8 TaxID=1854588 RepID=UPI0013043360|nr:2'-5' RNA ligase family protein [Pseudonocardia sp. MH-G8]
MTSPFPAELPADIDDHKSIAANDWAAFEKVDEMVNHWDRPGWRDGRRSYHWILSFAGNEELAAMAEECFPACSAHTFDQVPTDALHLTIRRVGFTDEIDRSVIDSIADRVRALSSEMGDFSLTVGPLAASRGAVRFSVAPWRSLFEIYDAVGSASTWVTGREIPSALDSFRPHVSIAYSGAPQKAEEIRRSIGKYRALPPVVCKVVKLRLVELRRESASYRWREIAGVDLA